MLSIAKSKEFTDYLVRSFKPLEGTRQRYVLFICISIKYFGRFSDDVQRGNIGKQQAVFYHGQNL
jgi:hypothetical protein